MTPETLIAQLGTFDPAQLHVLGEIYDEVWASIAPEIGKSRDAIMFARNALALIIVGLAKDHQLGAIQIARTAARLMRERSL